MGLNIKLYKDDKELVNDVVRQYMRAIETAYKQSDPKQAYASGKSADDAAQDARLVHSMLAQARIFAIHPEKWAYVHHAADRHTTDLAGLDWKPESDEDEPKNETEALIETYRSGIDLPFPEPLPFDCVYLGFGGKLKVGEATMLTRMTPDMIDEMGIRSIAVTGFLLGVVGDQPMAYVFMDFEGEGINKGEGMAIGRIYDSEGWSHPMSLDPWVVPILIQQINDHKTTILESHSISLTNRMDRKEIEKKGKMKILLPQPFYVVRLEDKLIDDAVKNRPQSPIEREWSHRWDVRGHDVVRIQKGKHPADPKLLAKLKKRGYRVYESTKPTGEDWERLNKKGIRLAYDDWVAVLSYWRDSHVKGPADRPYVPSVRV